MEREEYQKQINDLLQAVETLLKSNNTMGEELRRTEAAYEDLKSKYEKLEGELAMRKVSIQPLFRRSQIDSVPLRH